MTAALQIHATPTNSPLAAGKTVLVRDPHGVTRMLMDGALERLEKARTHDLCGADARTTPRGLVQSAVMIIDELRSGLDLHQGGAIAANVDDLYDYMCRRLQAADLGKAAPARDLAALDEVSHLLDALRSAWAFMPAEVRTAPRN